MSRCVDEVERVLLAIQDLIHLNSMALDGNASLSLQVHVIEHLSLHVLPLNRLGKFQQTVGQGALAVVDMGDDTEVPYFVHKNVSYSKFKLQSY